MTCLLNCAYTNPRSSPGSAELSQRAATTLNLNYNLGAAIGSLKEVVQTRRASLELSFRGAYTYLAPFFFLLPVFRLLA